MNIQGFDEIDALSSNTTVVLPIGIDFKDKTQPALFDITYNEAQISTTLTISCPVGELIEQRILNEKQFNENSGKKFNEIENLNVFYFFSSSPRYERNNGYDEYQRSANFKVKL